MRPRGYGYYKKEKRNYLEYGITWSNYLKVDKTFIIQKFSELTGIYVIFELNKYKRLEPIMVGTAWFNGFKSSLLRLYNDIMIDRVPKHVFEKVRDKKTFMKFIEIETLEDEVNIFYKLKEKYPEAYFDSSGLEEPKGLDRIKVVDINTKIYHKKRKVDI